MTRGAEVRSWAQQRISELEAENASLREAVEAVEWIAHDVRSGSPLICAWCGRPKGHGHAPNCQRQTALSPQQAILPNCETSQETTTYRWVCDNCGRWILTTGVSPKSCPACGGGQLYCYKGGPGGEG